MDWQFSTYIGGTPIRTMDSITAAAQAAAKEDACNTFCYDKATTGGAALSLRLC